MSDTAKLEYTLLTDDQVFGEGQIDLIRKLGTRCPVTDFAILSGAEVQDDVHTEEDSSLRGRSGRWFLRSAAGFGDVAMARADGSRGVAYTWDGACVRPAFACADPAALSEHVTKDLTGFAQVEFGEYPQYAADKELAGELEREFRAGRLRSTGKRYAAEYEEYLYKDRKYIRADYSAPREAKLSDGRRYAAPAGEKPGSREEAQQTDTPIWESAAAETVWIEAAPVKWLYDEQAGLLVSRVCLVFSTSFTSGKTYDGTFEGTGMYRFLNGDLAGDLVPSVPREMTAEEREAYEEEMKRAEEKRNPYGLTFGQVSEEDIIRGAIESDIAVFLHGPSSEGKSARVKQIDPTCEIIYLRNATPDSLNGRSVYNQATGEMIDIPPTWYKKVKAKCEAEPDKFHVVFFDEINNALPSIQGMAFNIVLDREVNGLWKLPDNARVVAAGNDMQDSLAANQIAAPFFNRFAHVYINTTTEKWLKWARDNHIHPAIYSYIAFRRGEPLRSEYTGERPNADPRKWEMASRMLYTTGRPEMLRALIGEEITDEFVQFCNQQVITLDQVMAGDVTERELEAMNTAERYATTMGLSQADEEQMKTVRAFVSRMGEEFRAVFDTLWANGEEGREQILAEMDAKAGD